MQRIIDPIKHPLPVSPTFLAKVQAAASSSYVFAATISSPSNIVFAYDTSLQDFLGSGIAMGAAAFYAWSIRLLDALPVPDYELWQFPKFVHVAMVVSYASKMLGELEPSAEIAAKVESFKAWYPVRHEETFPTKQPTVLTKEPGAHALCFAVHGILHVGVFPDELVIEKAMKQITGDDAWLKAADPAINKQMRKLLARLTRIIGPFKHMNREDTRPALLQEKYGVDEKVARQLVSEVDYLGYRASDHLEDA